MEGLEKRITRVQKAAKNMVKAYKVMNEASLQFQESLVPFAEGRDDHIIKLYAQTLGKVYESEMNLGDRAPSVLVDALQVFVDTEVKPGMDLHAKMAKARDAYDSANVKASKSKKKDPTTKNPELDDKKRDFEAANVKYVQKLIDFGAKKEFELMDIFTNWMVCSLTHHKRAWKLLDEMQPLIKKYKQQMLQERKGYKADEETRKVAVAESLAQNEKGSDSVIQGYLTSQAGVTRKRQWWAVANGMLAQYRNYSDFAPSESYDLLLFTVKPHSDDPCTFTLVSPQDNFALQAASPEEKQQWVTAISASISNQLNATSHAGQTDGSGGTTATSDPSHPLQQLRRGNESFRQCVDCGAKDPDWGAINLGVMFCINCSGIHRNLGVHISQVRSLTLDVDVWDEGLLRMMKGIGNSIANSVWEANYTGSPPRPKVGCDMKQREAFILAKYRDRAFLDPLPLPLEDGFLQLCASEEEPPAVKDVVHYVSSGVDLSAHDELGWTALQFLARSSDSLVLLEYLLRNGAPPNSADDAGNTALHVAATNGLRKVAMRLVHHGADAELANADGETPLQLGQASIGDWNGSRRASSGSVSKATSARSAITSSSNSSSPQRGRTWTSSAKPSPNAAAAAARLRGSGDSPTLERSSSPIVSARVPTPTLHARSTSTVEASDQFPLQQSPQQPVPRSSPRVASAPPKKQLPSPPPLPPPRLDGLPFSDDDEDSGARSPTSPQQGKFVLPPLGGAGRTIPKGRTATAPAPRPRPEQARSPTNINDGDE